VSGIKKIIAVPVVTDREGECESTITNTDGPLDKIISENHLNLKHCVPFFRLTLVQGAFSFLMRHATNPYTVTSNKEADVRRWRLKSLTHTDSFLPFGPEPQETGVFADLSRDPVEHNRNSLSFVASVFQHEPSQRDDRCPRNFLEVKHPYVKALPMFFPDGQKGLDDPGRMEQPTEGQYVMHYLRNVKKQLLEYPLYTFLGLYRLETRRFLSCCNALRGFVITDSDEVEAFRDDNRLQFIHLTGSADYYRKQYLDMEVKSETLGYPQIFYTFTSTDRWADTLASCLMQDGHNVWHVVDESEILAVLPGRESPLYDPEQECAVHRPLQGSLDCPYHENCRRADIHGYLTGAKEKDLMNRNLYTVNRVFDQRAKSLVSQVLSAPSNSMHVRAFHDVKEFGDVSGWAHMHGVAWRRTDKTEATFARLHNEENPTLTEREKQDIATLAESIVCVRLEATKIISAFPELSTERAGKISRLAASYQWHGCTKKCESEHMDSCKYSFPKEPSGLTLISAPPTQTMDKDIADGLVTQSDAVKQAVKNVLLEVSSDENLATMSLQRVLHRAIGTVVELEDGTGFHWKDGIFPQINNGQSHSVDRWRLKLAEMYEYPRPEILNVVAIYYTALATSCSGNHELVSRRAVSDVWIADYNPYCMEAMKSNMEVKIILSTPRKVFSYVTKGAMPRDFGSKQKTVSKLAELDLCTNSAKVADRAAVMREVCQSEAFFRIDKQLHLADSNITVAWVNSTFPDERGSTFRQVESDGIQLPGRPGQYQRTSRIEDRYQRR
jgi:hypothetical protein